MPFFMFIGHDHPPHAMALRDALRPEHRRYVLEHDTMIRLAGALLDRAGNQCGSVIVFDAGDAAEVRRWLAQEPFCCGGVYARTEVIEWGLALNRLERTEWTAARPAPAAPS
jgi:uncharacterized protein